MDEQKPRCKAMVAQLTDCLHSIESLLKAHQSTRKDLTQFHPESIDCETQPLAMRDADSNLMRCKTDLNFAKEFFGRVPDPPAPQSDAKDKPKKPNNCHKMAVKIIFCREHPHEYLDKDWWNPYSRPWDLKTRMRCSWLGDKMYQSAFALKGCCRKEDMMKDPIVNRACGPA